MESSCPPLFQCRASRLLCHATRRQCPQQIPSILRLAPSLLLRRRRAHSSAPMGNYRDRSLTCVRSWRSGIAIWHRASTKIIVSAGACATFSSSAPSPPALAPGRYGSAFVIAIARTALTFRVFSIAVRNVWKTLSSANFPDCGERVDHAALYAVEKFSIAALSPASQDPKALAAGSTSCARRLIPTMSNLAR